MSSTNQSPGDPDDFPPLPFSMSLVFPFFESEASGALTIPLRSLFVENEQKHSVHI